MIHRVLSLNKKKNFLFRNKKVSVENSDTFYEFVESLFLWNLSLIEKGAPVESTSTVMVCDVVPG